LICRIALVLRIACESLDHYRDLTNAWPDGETLGIERISSKPELQKVKSNGPCKIAA
jgi:hypothetical protein